jgi:uncharacterized protein YjbI with pentapeptide repeats
MSENPFDGPQLQGNEFARANMTDVRFNGVQLSGASFWAVMARASFKDTNLQSAVFDDVNLSEAAFTNINLAGSTIENANLAGLSINNANLSGVEINNANLIGMKINGVLVSDLFEVYETRSEG